MRKLLLVITSICIVTMLQAQVSKTVNVVTAGTLSSLLTASDYYTINKLTVTGSIDSLDFVIIHDMSALTVLDLSEAICIRIPSLNWNNSLCEIWKSSNTLISIILPSSLISIGDNAFWDCKHLSFITIPSSVTSIELAAFYGCISLKSINIPASVTNIEDLAFNGIDSIYVDSNNLVYSAMNGVLFNKAKTTLLYYPISIKGSYSIPTSVKEIKNYAFNYCNELTNISIPSSVTSIGFEAFSDCSGLTSIMIPPSVTSIGAYAFWGIDSIYVDSNNHVFSIIDGVLFDIQKKTLKYCPSSKQGSYSIPNFVDTIGNGAFHSCKLLTSIFIPSSVKYIDLSVFYGCNGLTSITIPSSITNIEGSVFFLDSTLQSIYAYPITPINLSNSYDVFFNVKTTTCILYVPIGSLAAYKTANQWQDFTHIVEMSGMWTTDSTILLSSVSNSSMTISVQTTGKWTVTSSVSWLSFSPSSGTGNDSITIIAQANPTDSIRTATITVSSDASVSLKSTNTNSKTITLTQAAGTGTTTGFTTGYNKDLSLYPNPATSSFTINNEGKAKLSIYDLQGN